MISAIDLALQLLQGVLEEVTTNKLPKEIAVDVQAAVDALLKVKGSDVTYSQLEQLRVKATF